MAGLIDAKTRVIDAKLTLVGRRSLVDGGLSIAYASFSDVGAVYTRGDNNVADEPLGLGFEAFSTPWDELSFTSDELGIMRQFVGDEYIVISDGTVKNQSGSAAPPSMLTAISSGSFDSFTNQRLIKTVADGADGGFSFIPSRVITFTVRDGSPFSVEPSEAIIDDVEGLFADRRLSKVTNFLFLPPIQRAVSSVGSEVSLGTYMNVSEIDQLTDGEIEVTISDLQTRTLTFSRLTDSHRLMIQAFETSDDGIKQLDVIEWGQLSELDDDGRARYLYFLGKVIDDGSGIPTFVNIFDLVVR